MSLLTGEVSRLAEGCWRKRLRGRELGEIDSVKKVSMLGDIDAERLGVGGGELRAGKHTARQRGKRRGWKIEDGDRNCSAAKRFATCEQHGLLQRRDRKRQTGTRELTGLTGLTGGRGARGRALAHC